MSKYEPLAQFLDRQASPIWQADFSEIERVLGFSLPKSAHQHQAWWANQEGRGHSQTAGWRDVGWRTCNIDLPAKRVTFERQPKAQRTESFDDSETKDQFAVRGAIEYLISLGGAMPDLVVPPRERSGG